MQNNNLNDQAELNGQSSEREQFNSKNGTGLSAYGVDDYRGDVSSKGDVKSDVSGANEVVNKKKEVDVSSYEDLGGVTIRKLSIGLWFLEHKEGVYKFLTLLLAVVAIGFLGFGMWGFGSYFLFGYQDDQRIIAGISDGPQANTQIFHDSRPNNLLISDVVIVRANGKYDLMVEVENPNPRFYASLQYCFNYNGQDLACGNDFVLPSTMKFVSSLSVKAETLNTAQFMIKDLKWNRIDPKVYSVWEDYFAEHLDFQIANIDFETLPGEAGSSIKFNTLSFDAHNRSAFNYREVPFNIILFRGASPIGIYRLVRTNFMSGETQSIKITWPGDYGSVGHVEIMPDIDISRNDVYLNFESK